jgi:hypothetical protein
MLRYLLSSATEDTLKFLKSSPEIISTGDAFKSLDSIYEATEIISSVSWAKTKLFAKVKIKNGSKILKFMQQIINNF